MTSNEVTARRQVVLYHMRLNPKGTVQGKFKLHCLDGSKCALGLMAEALNIPTMPEPTGPELNQEAFSVNTAAYNKLRELLEWNDMRIWGLNDRQDKTFAEIADILDGPDADYYDA